MNDCFFYEKGTGVAHMQAFKVRAIGFFDTTSYGSPSHGLEFVVQVFTYAFNYASRSTLWSTWMRAANMCASPFLTPTTSNCIKPSIVNIVDVWIDFDWMLQCCQELLHQIRRAGRPQLWCWKGNNHYTFSKGWANELQIEWFGCFCSDLMRR